jgi:AmmeMemoRadiSam system protein B
MSLGTYVRSASHAGSWYESDPSRLRRTIDQMLSVEPPQGFSPCTNRLWGLIGPHAGLRYCGETSGAAYGILRRFLYGAGASARTRKFFILGPSHCKYLEGVEVSGASAFNTPFGRLPVDVEVLTTIRARCASLGVPCGIMQQQTDEDEHSIEMHLPFLSHVLHYPTSAAVPSLASQGATIVPIVVGECGERMQKLLVEALSPYMSSKDCFFIISSDFCHWGSRFRFTHHFMPQQYPDIGDAIVAMDRQGMELIAARDLVGWHSYLSTTKNTICGRNPISVAMVGSDKESCSIQFVGYSQSSRCTGPADSSVSYASAIIGN